MNVSFKVLELGIIVHSVIIGMTVGASGSASTIRPLVAALTFHQFFEGLGLGGCIVQVCPTTVLEPAILKQEIKYPS